MQLQKYVKPWPFGHFLEVLGHSGSHLLGSTYAPLSPIVYGDCPEMALERVPIYIYTYICSGSNHDAGRFLVFPISDPTI